MGRCGRVVAVRFNWPVPDTLADGDGRNDALRARVSCGKPIAQRRDGEPLRLDRWRTMR
ncbi:hypothetical protein XAC3612_2240006 [Xanthomonas citri pv. citri]|nr:hypothetical protein XAC3612_2240006 [Xanthomonas citri pv. citri]